MNPPTESCQDVNRSTGDLSDDLTDQDQGGDSTQTIPGYRQRDQQPRTPPPITAPQDSNKRNLLITAEINLDDKPDTGFAIARNISQQREVHKQLRLLKFALDRVSEAAYLLDENARLLHVNETSCNMLGYRYLELVARRVFDIDPDYSPTRWSEHWQQMLQTGSRTLFSHHKNKEGRLIPVEINTARFELNGQFYGLALVKSHAQSGLTDLAADFRAHELIALVENSADIVARYDRQCRCLYSNINLARQAGLSVVDLLGKRPSEQWTDSSGLAYENALQTAMASGSECEIELSWPSANGQIICNRLALKPEFSKHGQVTGVLVIGRDITELKESERRLYLAESMAHLGHWEWTPNSNKFRVSVEMCRIFGAPPTWKPKLNEILAMVVHEDRRLLLKTLHHSCRRQATDVDLGSYRIQGSKHIRHLRIHIRAEYSLDGVLLRLIGTTLDITEQKNFESQLQKIAFHDALTGLPNRAQLAERLKHFVEMATRQGGILGLIVIDIDRFKEINDTYGHNFGDLLLRNCTERLRHLLRDYDTVARLGGDEFAIVCPNIREAADLGSISQKILDSLALPFQLDTQEIFISASIGIAAFPRDGKTTTELFQYADAALYDAKSRGRAGFRFYSAELTTKSKERAVLEIALRRAEMAGELEVFYQPKISLADGSLVGAEALLRWHHPEQGLVQPNKFISIAEDTGLIVSIGAWVLKQACLTAKRWNESGERCLKIAVNLSSRQFRNNDLVATVIRILRITGCKPSWLEFEITESLLLDDKKEIGTTLNAFRKMGISIAIDDFGTGYSSLAYLKRFPINVLKIDRSFISDVMLDSDSTELVKGIITMAHSMHLELVAEGVETDIQEQFLHAHGCHLGQGYRYGKPMPCSAFELLPHIVGRTRPPIRPSNQGAMTPDVLPPQ
jgi:diguanylate cyclase (GGDEF)-like protein/PAS domain S-box-containing protein